jgi:hypothetical protein
MSWTSILCNLHSRYFDNASLFYIRLAHDGWGDCIPIKKLNEIHPANSIETLEYSLKHGCITKDQLWRVVIASHNPSLISLVQVRWNPELTISDINYMIEIGQQEMVDRFFNVNLNLSRISIIVGYNQAARFGHVEILKLLARTFRDVILGSYELIIIIENAIQGQHLAVIQWYYKQGFPQDLHYMQFAYKTCPLNIIQWMMSVQWPGYLDSWGYTPGFEYPTVQVLEFLHNRGQLQVDNFIVKSCEKNRPDILIWWYAKQGYTHKTKPEIPSSWLWTIQLAQWGEIWGYTYDVKAVIRDALSNTDVEQHVEWILSRHDRRLFNATQSLHEALQFGWIAAIPVIHKSLGYTFTGDEYHTLLSVSPPTCSQIVINVLDYMWNHGVTLDRFIARGIEAYRSELQDEDYIVHLRLPILKWLHKHGYPLMPELHRIFIRDGQGKNILYLEAHGVPYHVDYSWLSLEYMNEKIIHRSLSMLRRYGYPISRDIMYFILGNRKHIPSPWMDELLVFLINDLGAPVDLKKCQSICNDETSPVDLKIMTNIRTNVTQSMFKSPLEHAIFL